MTAGEFHIPQATTGLRLAEDGIWYAESSEALSYPEDGNADCFALEDNSFWFKHRNRCIGALLEKYTGPVDRPLLDIGGGNGTVAASLEEQGFPAVLVEPGPTGAKNAQTRGLKNIICATTHSAGFLPESLPAVGLFDVVEHIEDDLKFMRHIYSLMRPGGKLFITLPAYTWLWSGADESAGHFRRHNTRSSRDLLKASGFDMQFFSYIFAFLPLPSLILRSLPYRLGLQSGDQKVSQNNLAKDHMSQQSMGNKLVGKLLSWEVDRLARGKTIPMGGSCILVAQKPG